MKDVLSTIESLKDASKNNQSSSAGWVAALVAGALAIIAIIALAIRAWQLGKERAKLLHEKALAEENEHQAGVDQQLADAGDKLVDAIMRRKAAQDEVTRLTQLAKEIETQRNDAHATIDMITSWDDVDSIVR